MKSKFFRDFLRMQEIARLADRKNLTSKEATEIWNSPRDRRRFLADIGKGAASAAFLSMLGPWRLVYGAPVSSTASVGIVGAGMAGLTAAYELKKAGVNADLYEAATRAGGRVWSLSGTFPGQTIERGGELIDNLHKTMLSYAQEFNLEKEDVNKTGGEVFYYLDGQLYPEAAVVEEYRKFVEAMRGDIRNLSAEVKARSFSEFDRRLDETSLEDYLKGKNSLGMPAGRIAYKVIKTAYTIEYGLETEEQSSLNFLQFIHADRRSKFTPWGVFSDERWHITNGNERIVDGLLNRVGSQVNTDMRLVKIRKTSGGRIELTFTKGSSTLTKVHDIVLLTLPFSVLRNVQFDASLELPPAKQNAIQTMGYGTNAKLMMGFNGPYWRELGNNGAAYSDLPNHQSNWESNCTKATPENAVLVDYTGGRLGASLDPKKAQSQAAAFLADLDKIYARISTRAAKSGSGYRIHMEAWPRNPNSLGSYTCYKPGQFTSVAGLEGESVGNLHFGGEHTDSFYSWQGFMEGAALSGLREAAAILAKLRK